ncbi:NUDIX domain-containing protein [Pseudoclavibacter chungangensis]|uniref:NUDIX domain-containing protein n=1 Tax=Pseudoclavibacter chungangensis TaxID=587635 RepID=A0A7J5BVW6_9MICO|nr:NUDIX domain-containing protein [Pseudoclavibacter chungangensis]KAB1658013.1 NUDIX domain-containing protein [Pseudoclavibacter chungangensis]NYJ65823.1 8-oxo-dGTP pyrophosphatase MutT (NUDIX family) [Pseudoclavibacter chungangensis]
MSDAAPIRSAVTLMLVRASPLRVLMVRRGDVGAFAGALAFPGGVVDPDDASPEWLGVLDGAHGLDVDERARRVAVVRELYEETGLVFGHADPRRGPVGDDLRRVCLEGGLRLDVGSIRPVSRWVTPAGYPKRFDTRFYVAAVDGEPIVRADGLEIASLGWESPRDLVERAGGAGVNVMLPTLANLQRLAATGPEWGAWADAFERAPDPVEPTLRVREGGVRVVAIPAVAGSGPLELPID